MSSVIPYRSKQNDPNNQVLQNGEWIQRLDRSLTIDPGDIHMVTQSFVDTQQLSAENVVITEDISVGMDLMYYETNHDFTDKQSIVGTNAKDYQKYLVYHRDPDTGIIAPVIKTAEILIPAGSYTPDRLAGLISREFSQTGVLLDSNRLVTNNNLLIRTDDVGNGSIIKLNNIDWGTKPYPYAAITQLSGPQTSWGPNSTKDFAYYLGDGNTNQGFNPRGGGWVSLRAGLSTPVIADKLGHSDHHIFSSGTSGVGSGMVLAVYPTEIGENTTDVGWFGPNWDTPSPADKGNKIYYTIVNGGNGYQVGDDVYFASDSFAFLSPTKDGATRYSRCPAGGTLTLTVQAISADTSGYFEFIKLGENPEASTASYRYTANAPYFIGASEADLEYNDNNNGSFSWNYLHTPIYKNENNEPLQPAVQLGIDTTTQEWSTIQTDSGVLVTGFRPVSFWRDTLNFPISDLIVRDDSGSPITSADTTTISNIDGKYTYGFLGLNSYLSTNSTTQARKVPTSNITIATTLTKPLQADEFAINTGAGYYILEIEGFYKQEITSGQGVFQASAIISKQYNNSDIVWSESGIPYVHKGEPITFDTFKVRIIDPDTGEVAQGLGDDNSFFVQITKNEQPPPQKK